MVVDIIQPGETSPFYVFADRSSSNYKRFEIKATWSTTEEDPVEAFIIIDPEIFEIGGGEKRFVGRLHNNSEVEVAYVELVYACRTSEGVLKEVGGLGNIGPEVHSPGGTSWFRGGLIWEETISCKYTAYGLMENPNPD